MFHEDHVIGKYMTHDREDAVELGTLCCCEGGKSATPNLDELRHLSGKLAMLVADPQPGLMGWSMLLAKVCGQIGEFS